MGLNKKYYNFWTCHLPTSNTHIIMTTNQVHHKYNKYLKQKWGTLVRFNIISIVNKTASGIEQTKNITSFGLVISLQVVIHI